jgi:glycosyltransferase involved in cell wall biosynthesis
VRILVATIVHPPDDSRILHRQIRSLLDAGHQVTYAAPFTDHGVDPWPELEAVDLPIARDRAWLSAALAAGRVIADYAESADVVLLHDLELLVSVPRIAHPCIVWDVHDDNATAMTLRPWLPAPLRPPAAVAAHFVERWAERHVRLILADDACVPRFRRLHPVVPNATVVPESVCAPIEPRAVSLGRLAFERGLGEMIEAARRLRGAVTVELIGSADGPARRAVERAHAAGDVRWLGSLPLAAALERLPGACAGLSLPHQMRHGRSQATALLEYMSYGVPVVTTGLPGAAGLIGDHRCGMVVPFADAAAVARSIGRLADDQRLAAAMGARGHAATLASYDWRAAGPRFVRQLESWTEIAARKRRLATRA